MKNIIKLFIFVILFTAAYYCPAQTNNQNNTYIQEFKNVKDSIELYYYSFNIAKIKEILNKTTQLEKKYTGKWQPCYYSGMLNYLLGKISYLKDRGKAFDYFEESVDCFLKSLKLNKSAEIYALLSAAYGKMSSLSTISAIYYGIKSKDYIYKANELDDNNSKVFLIAATHLMHTPETFGGDKQYARKLLLKALEKNKNHIERDTLYIDWAADAEIYAYLAQLEILKKNKTEALKYINKALELIPNYDFVKKDILHQYEKIK